MQLADNDPLRPVDDEGAIFGHQRDLTKVDFLLLDVPDGLGFDIPLRIKNDQSDHNLQRRRVSHSFLDALLLIIPDGANPVADELQGTFSAEIRNRKDAVKGALQTIVRPFIRIDPFLKKFLIGVGLDIDQVRDIQYSPDTAKIFSKYAHNFLSA
ncbi:MAG: hypothetical protein ACD_87C00215G0004 [uncultured bacterium]|nr:MAG: hypothetical protein ACD_87C00215G0004 [uncultured bacterium]